MTPVIVPIRNEIVALSGLTNTQVAFGTLPKGSVLPYIALAEINSNRGYTHDGADGTNTTLVQANIYAKSYIEAKQLARELVSLQDYTSDTVASVQVDNESDGFDDSVDRFSTGLDFIVRHYEGGN